MALDKNVLVLGSSSFAGGAMTNQLLQLGVRVVGVCRSSSNLMVGDRLKNLSSPLYRELRFDTSNRLSSIFEIVDFATIDWILDFANQGMVAPSWDSPDVWYRTNLGSKSDFLKNLVARNWRGRYLKVSTPEVYGSVDGAMSPDACLSPSTPYAISHAAFDQHLLALNASFGLDIIIGRFANFYGEGQQLYRIIPRSILCGLSGRELFLDGGGLSERAFIHRDDFCDGMLKCLTSGLSGQVYHFSDPEALSIKEIVQKCLASVGRDFEDIVTIGPERIGKDHRYLLNCASSQEELGWSPSVNLGEGIARVTNWIVENYGALQQEPMEYKFKS